MTWPSNRTVGGGWWCQYGLLCAAQKLLCADAIAPAYPQNDGEVPMMENLKPLQLRGRYGPLSLDFRPNAFVVNATSWPRGETGSATPRCQAPLLLPSVDIGERTVFSPAGFLLTCHPQ
jgi:hypothetical protein